MQQRGLFWSIEGVEGSGKSTMLSYVQELLAQQGFDVITTREPGGTPLAEKIRSILLTHDESEELCPMSELLLMYAARAQHVQKKIIPALEAGKMVISDRFDLSTIAYQGAGRGVDLKVLEELRTIAINSFLPDLTLLFDVDVTLGMQRVIARGKRDRFELEDIEFFERIRKGYLDYATAHPDKVVIIDTSVSLDEVKDKVKAVVLDKLDKSRG